MILKIRSFVIVSFLAILFSGVAYGENLLIGGINQDQTGINDYTNYAKQIGAEYIPMYTGSEEANVREVRNAALGIPTDQNGLKLDELNGKNELSGKKYDTIVAYSGGTSSAVTALDKQGVTCDTLILISPMAAGVPDSVLGLGTGLTAATAGITGTAGAVGGAFLGMATGPLAPVAAPAGAVGGFATGAAAGTVVVGGATSLVAMDAAQKNFNAQIDRILKSGAAKNIVVIQSPEDKLPLDYVYQYRFSEGANKQITVHNIELKSKGEDAHKELFFDYAEKNLKADNNGKIIYLPDQPILNKESNAFKKPEKPSLAALLGLSTPLLSPSTPGWSSDQNKEGANAPKTSDASDTSGGSYFDNANDVWYIDAFSWSGDRSLQSKPAAPLRFVSGERNTYGYNWIYLPYEQTGMTYDQGYYDWALETLASIGMPGPSAGYGLLIDEGQNGGGSW